MDYNKLTCKELEEILYNDFDVNLLLFDAEYQREESKNLRLGLSESLFLEVYQNELETIRNIDLTSKEEIKKFECIFDLLYNKSFEDNYFWEFCPFEVYKNNFQKRFIEFRKQNFDAEILDFIKIELENIELTFKYCSNPFETYIRLFHFKDETSVDLSYINNFEKQTFSQRKKIIFLHDIIDDLNNKIEEKKIIKSFTQSFLDNKEQPTKELHQNKGYEHTYFSPIELTDFDIFSGDTVEKYKLIFHEKVKDKLTITHELRQYKSFHKYVKLKLDGTKDLNEDELFEYELIEDLIPFELSKVIFDNTFLIVEFLEQELKNFNTILFKEDTDLQSTIYNINLFLDTLNSIVKILRPITRENDLKFVNTKMYDLENLFKILDKSFLSRYIEICKLYSDDKINHYILVNVNGYYKEILVRWRQYYNDEIFKKSLKFNLFWNEDFKIKEFVYKTESYIKKTETLINDFINKNSELKTINATQKTETNQKDDLNYNNQIFNSFYAENLYTYLKENYTNKHNHKYLYIYEYLKENNHIKVVQYDYEIFVFGKYKNLRYSDRLKRMNEIQKLKELEDGLNTNK